MKNNSLTNRIKSFLDKAILLFNRFNYDDSLELLLKVLDEDPANPEANYYIGLIYSKENNWLKALVHFKSVVDINANFLFTQQCRMLLGYIYFQNNEYKRAEREYMEVLKSDVNIVQVHAALSAITHYLNEKDRALEYAEKALEIDPYNLNAKNTYGFLLCEYEIDIQKGLDIIRGVVRIKPNNPAYLDSLGWAYFKKGDIRASLASLKKALEISNNPEIKEHFNRVVEAL